MPVGSDFKWAFGAVMLVIVIDLPLGVSRIIQGEAIIQLVVAKLGSHNPISFR